MRLPIEKAINELFKKKNIPDTISSYVAFMEGIEFITSIDEPMEEGQFRMLKMSIENIIERRKRHLTALVNKKIQDNETA